MGGEHVCVGCGALVGTSHGFGCSRAGGRETVSEEDLIDLPRHLASAAGTMDRIATAFERVADATESATLSFERIASALDKLTEEQPEPARPDPLRAEYDEATGRNQWGTRNHGVCAVCESDVPVNSNGIGECRQCGHVLDPRRSRR